MSEFANPVKSWIFSRQIPVNQKSLPVIIYGWANANSFFYWTFEIPQILIKNNLGDVQKTGISSDMRPAFLHEFFKKWIGYVYPLT